MKNLTRTISAVLLSLGLLLSASIASAAFVDHLYYLDATNLPTEKPKGDMYLVTDADDYITIGTTGGTTGPTEAYLFDNSNPSSINGAHLQFALDSYNTAYAPLADYQIINFTSSGNDVFPGLTVDAGGKTGTYDASPLFFTGFMIKAGSLTLVALFDDAIQSLTWNTNWTGDFKDFIGNTTGSSNNALSHMAVINAVPIPAAAFMFAPALLGFMGLRRRAKNNVA